MLRDTNLTREKASHIAQAIAVEAVVGVLLRDGNVDNERVMEWIKRVVAKSSEAEAGVIVSRAIWFAQRMTGGGSPTDLMNYL